MSWVKVNIVPAELNESENHVCCIRREWKPCLMSWMKVNIVSAELHESENEDNRREERKGGVAHLELLWCPLPPARLLWECILIVATTKTNGICWPPPVPCKLTGRIT